MFLRKLPALALGHGEYKPYAAEWLVTSIKYVTDKKVAMSFAIVQNL